MLVSSFDSEEAFRSHYRKFLLEFEDATLDHIGTVHTLLAVGEVTELRHETLHVGVLSLGIAEDEMSGTVERLKRSLDTSVFVALVTGIRHNREHSAPCEGTLVNERHIDLLVDWVLEGVVLDPYLKVLCPMPHCIVIDVEEGINEVGGGHSVELSLDYIEVETNGSDETHSLERAGRDITVGRRRVSIDEAGATTERRDLACDEFPEDIAAIHRVIEILLLSGLVRDGGEDTVNLFLGVLLRPRGAAILVTDVDDVELVGKVLAHVFNGTVVVNDVTIDEDSGRFGDGTGRDKSLFEPCNLLLHGILVPALLVGVEVIHQDEIGTLSLVTSTTRGLAPTEGTERASATEGELIRLPRADVALRAIVLLDTLISLEESLERGEEVCGVVVRVRDEEHIMDVTSHGEETNLHHRTGRLGELTGPGTNLEPLLVAEDAASGSLVERIRLSRAIVRKVVFEPLFRMRLKMKFTLCPLSLRLTGIDRGCTLKIVAVVLKQFEIVRVGSLGQSCHFRFSIWSFRKAW